MISFEDARRIVGIETGEPIAPWGWENDEVFVLAIDYTDGDMPIGEAEPLVDKRTGTLRWVSGMMGEPPAPGLRPIGKPPD